MGDIMLVLVLDMHPSQLLAQRVDKVDSPPEYSVRSKMG